MSTKYPARPFKSAKEEAALIEKLRLEAKTPQELSPAYNLAFLDQDFLLRKDLRPIRLQLELLKPELELVHEQIETTIVVFGSARILEPAKAQKLLNKAKRAATLKPKDNSLKKQVKIAERGVANSIYYEQARKFSELVSAYGQSHHHEENHFVVVTGGGPGIMEAANRGAHDVFAKSIGLGIVLPKEMAPNRYITPNLCFRFHYFAIRKMHFLIRARALVAFPGGFGTLDELFEALTLIQNHKIKSMPVLLFGRDFWSRMINFDTLVEEGMISEEDLQLFQYVETAEEAWQAIAHFYEISID